MKLFLSQTDSNFWLEAMMITGKHIGFRTFVTEAGHHHSEKPQPVAWHFQESVWNKMVPTGRELGRIFRP